MYFVTSWHLYLNLPLDYINFLLAGCTPVFRRGLTWDVSNYRPISFTRVCHNFITTDLLPRGPCNSCFKFAAMPVAHYSSSSNLACPCHFPAVNAIKLPPCRYYHVQYARQSYNGTSYKHGLN